MPVISFSTMKEDLLSGKKKQTIRPKITNYWLRFKKGDRLVAYWKLRRKGVKWNKYLFEATLTEDPFVIRWIEFTDKLMQRDCFESLEQANREWFIPRYGVNNGIVPEKEFVVLRW